MDWWWLEFTLGGSELAREELGEVRDSGAISTGWASTTCAAGAVIDGCVEDGGDVLNEGAVAPDVEGLGAVADGEDRLVQVEGVLQQQFVDGGAGGVGGAAGGDGFFTEALRVNVVEAAGEQHALRGREQARDAILPLVQRDQNGHGPGGVQRG